MRGITLKGVNFARMNIFHGAFSKIPITVFPQTSVILVLHKEHLITSSLWVIHCSDLSFIFSLDAKTSPFGNLCIIGGYQIIHHSSRASSACVQHNRTRGIPIMFQELHRSQVRKLQLYYDLTSNQCELSSATKEEALDKRVKKNYFIYTERLK